MKKIVYTLVVIAVCSSTVQAQGLKGLIKKATTKDSTTNGKSVLEQIGSSSSKSLSSTDVASGLKEALQIGAQQASNKLSSVDGFLGNAAIKILLPPEAQKVEKTLRSMGMEKQVNDAITSMNRAAEDAAKSAAPIFVDAVKSMSIEDAFVILNGGDSAATKYLQNKTNVQLSNAFRPVIQQSLDKVDATKYWNTLATTYNKVPMVKKVNTDITSYVTEKALSGIFYQLAQEELKIRKNPLAQTTDLLKKVFGSK